MGIDRFDKEEMALAGSCEEEKRISLNGVSLTPPTFDKTKQGTMCYFMCAPSDGFSPNINIQNQLYVDGIKAYDELSSGQFRDSGWTLKTKNLEKNEVYYEIINDREVGQPTDNCAFIMRAIDNQKGNVILCTATLKCSDVDSPLFESLKASVLSFRLE